MNITRDITITDVYVKKKLNNALRERQVLITIRSQIPISVFDSVDTWSDYNYYHQFLTNDYRSKNTFLR